MGSTSASTGGRDRSATCHGCHPSEVLVSLRSRRAAAPRSSAGRLGEGLSHRRPVQPLLHRGVGVTVDFLSGKSAPERLYETKQWDGPPISKFENGKTVGMTDSIQVKCDWQNDGPTRLSYPHEMCFAIGYYWPADSGIMCTSGGGTDDCHCQYQGKIDTGPGGSTVEIKVSYQDGIPGVKGDITDGSPIYCALFRAQDWEGIQPKAGAQPYYFRDQVDVPLKTSSDAATFSIADVTPGEYVATCFMDNIHGGFTPGSGDILSTVSPKVTAVAGKTAHTKAQLDFAIP